MSVSECHPPSSVVLFEVEIVSRSLEQVSKLLVSTAPSQVTYGTCSSCWPQWPVFTRTQGSISSQFLAVLWVFPKEQGFLGGSTTSPLRVLFVFIICSQNTFEALVLV